MPTKTYKMFSQDDLTWRMFNNFADHVKKVMIKEDFMNLTSAFDYELAKYNARRTLRNTVVFSSVEDSIAFRIAWG